MTRKPMVTVMIATKDRHEDLAVTVRDLRRQHYECLEMVVIDDASTPPVESIVREYWREARVVRHEVSRGQSARRNEGFRLANGKYILHLDDDCSPVAVDGILQSVEYMENAHHCAGIAYYVWNGKEMPHKLATSTIAPGVCLTFLGAAAFLRKAALSETAGYREVFTGPGEEAELSLQLLKRGWSLSYRPEIVAHHRYSARNRNKPAVYKLLLRNKLWTILIHFPMWRIPMEFGWKVTIGAWDAFRLRRGRLFVEALFETARGVGKMWRLRDPLDQLSLRRFDALRAYVVLPFAMFDNPPAQKWAEFKGWAKRWPIRLREGSFYSKRANLGRGPFPTHEHEVDR
jgi:GT2 family glycosyltransferase